MAVGVGLGRGGVMRWWLYNQHFTRQAKLPNNCMMLFSSFYYFKSQFAIIRSFKIKCMTDNVTKSRKIGQCN